jgi:hypothetical protein
LLLHAQFVRLQLGSVGQTSQAATETPHFVMPPHFVILSAAKNLSFPALKPREILRCAQNDKN